MKVRVKARVRLGLGLLCMFHYVSSHWSIDGLFFIGSFSVVIYIIFIGCFRILEFSCGVERDS